MTTILIDWVVACSAALNRPCDQWACFRMLGGPSHNAQGIMQHVPIKGKVQFSGSPHWVPLLHAKRFKREALAHHIRDGVRRSVCRMAEVGSVGVESAMHECGPTSWVPMWNQQNHLGKSSQRPAKRLAWRRTRDATWVTAEASPLLAASQSCECLSVMAVTSVNAQCLMSSQSLCLLVSGTSAQTMGGMIKPRLNGSLGGSAIVPEFILDPSSGE